MIQISKRIFYVEESASRRERIVDYYLESDDRINTIYTLQLYLDTGNIRWFKELLENDERERRAEFLYITTFGLEEEFALRLIRRLGITRTPKTEPAPELKPKKTLYDQKTGTLKGKRRKINKIIFVRVNTKEGKKLIPRAIDKKGRFLKTRKY